MRSVSRLVLLGSLLVVAAPAEAPAAPREGVAPPVRVSPGRFVLRGTARPDVAALPARDYPIDALALVAPGKRPGSVQLHLRSRGHACELRGEVAREGLLTLEPGQTCLVEQQGEQPARITAQLRAGSGRLSERELSLELDWSLDGTMSVSSGGKVTIPGTTTEITLPAAPPVPVRGTVRAAASGGPDAPARPAPRP
jgi:hypothetical protein